LPSGLPPAGRNTNAQSRAQVAGVTQRMGGPVPEIQGKLAQAVEAHGRDRAAPAAR
jgi:hypothetical protein